MGGVGFYLPNYSDIDLWNEVASLMNTLHNLIRQNKNGVGGLNAKLPDNHTFIINGRTLVKTGAVADLERIAGFYGFVYGGSDADKEKLGTLSSLLTLIAFKARLAEARTSNLEITVTKAANVTTIMKLDQLYLEPAHAMLLSGVNLSPTVKSTQKGSLGPITIALQLANTKDKNYQKAWMKTFCQVFKLFPDCSDIANLLAGSGIEHAAIIRALADIALFGTTRASNKFYPPLAMLMSLAAVDPTYRALLGAPQAQAIPDQNLNVAIKNMNFSGSGMWHFWNEGAKFSYTLNKGSLTVRIAQELVVHAAFGTHKEDLSLVQYMTGHEFLTRKEIGDKMQKRMARKEALNLPNLISFTKVCKLANAAQTDYLTGSHGQSSYHVHEV